MLHMENVDMADVAQVNDEQTLEKIAVVHEELNLEVASAQVQDVAQATITVAPATQNATTSVPPLNVQVQHEVLSIQTLPLLIVPVTVIPEPSIIEPSIFVTAALATTIPPILYPFFPTLQQSTLIPTPTTAKATT
ncbi:hypothetical protein Tco_1581619 [Tanacetum coccineum]